MAYLPIPTKTEGGQKEVPTSDDDVQGLMTKILKELKKMNLHLELMTDEKVQNSDID